MFYLLGFSSFFSSGFLMINSVNSNTPKPVISTPTVINVEMNEYSLKHKDMIPNVRQIAPTKNSKKINIFLIL